MSDAELHARSRIAAATGEDDGRAARDAARAGLGLVARIRTFVGVWVYVEGARMNYRGLLTEVFVEPSGRIEAIMLEPAWRLGWWETPEAGPRSGYHFKLEGAAVVPWSAVQGLHEQFKGWPEQ